MQAPGLGHAPAHLGNGSGEVQIAELPHAGTKTAWVGGDALSQSTQLNRLSL